MNRVSERRQELGLTQQDLLKLLKQTDPRMDIGLLSKIESGIALPSYEIMTALERHLQAAQSDLFDDIVVFRAQNTKAPVGRITAIVAHAIPEGKANAIKREELPGLFGVCDRTAREWIAAAKRDGLLINNDQDGVGYYQPVTTEEIARGYWQTQNRTMSQLVQQKYRRARMKG